MQALQPRPVSGEGADPFWEQQHMPDLDNFLQGLLSEPVDLNASLVPAALAVSFGLSTDSSVSSLPPRAAAARRCGVAVYVSCRYHGTFCLTMPGAKWHVVHSPRDTPS